ncbi:hypothetical protein OI25_7274 [Paraburkholderia fungorum]|jgi:hypothetical protein|uniref:Transcriptional regulator n=1 Tax=Paraburkholderia fungorum TaxID=134537 RepID=A0AAU8SU03_9BURK|nr:hypothetical protein OI25_7274 [Paraburkholderia fungorum]PRZ49255.1 hypothetical protein BX589_126164 [Paraburkholderia fungorum]
MGFIVDQKQVEALTTSPSVATDKIHGPLNALALVKLVDAFYSPDDRMLLLKEIDDAYVACNVAYEAMAAGTPTARSWTDEQKSEHQRLLNAKVECDRVVDELRKEHKLLFRLRDARDTLSKSKYE